MKPPEFNTKRPSSCLQNRGHFNMLERVHSASFKEKVAFGGVSWREDDIGVGGAVRSVLG